jgi:hypothetical protein
MSKNKTLIALLVVTLLLTSYFFSDATTSLQGCNDPSSIADPLKQISQTNWKLLDRAKVKEVWPFLLYELGHKQKQQSNNEIYVDLNSLGRFINDICECCDLFEFVVSERNEALRSIVIFYSSTSEKIINETGEIFLQAVGYPSKSRELKIGDRKLFTWDTLGLRNVVDIDIYRSNNKWTLRFEFRKHSSTQGEAPVIENELKEP